MIGQADILEFLPRTDCGQCGLTCAEFAALLLSRERSPEECPVLHEPDYAGYIEALHELLAQAPPPVMQVDAERCNGCGICVAMCEYHLGNCPEARLGRGPRFHDLVVFHIVNGTAVVVRQDLCTRMLQAAEKCSKCAEHCPTEAISFKL
ncbi:MAG: (Fe-S)-binding protein [Deltaproteobacteria bacterium]|nr:(Fe-S)-binding protein [Deltaproteobacteria bacterium]